MLTIAYYFLQVVLCSGLLMGYYLLVLRNKRFHQYNRFYLLAVALFSWIVPLIKIQWGHPVVSDDAQMLQFLSVVADNNSEIEANILRKGFQWTWDTLAVGLYMLVATALLIGMLRSLIKVYRLLKYHSCKNVGDVYLVLTNANGTPFSFFRYIFWNEEIDIRSESGKQILQHELTHVRQKHSIDKIMISIMLIGGWFNPFFWLLKKEMEMIHEFIADKKAVANGDTASLAQMLLAAAYPGQQFSLTNPFFFSPIRRRLQMLTTHKNPRFSYIRRLIILPLLAIVVVLFAFRNKEQREESPVSVASVMENVISSITNESSSPSNKIFANTIPTFNKPLGRAYTVLIDPGHGGSDKGAIAPDGTSEASITLQLAKSIQELNTNENIQIVLSRNNDVSRGTENMAGIISRVHPDLLISLHTNDAKKINRNGVIEENPLNGIEFYIPSKEKAADYAGSQLLANVLSNAMSQLNTQMRGIKTRAKGINELDVAKSPAVLIETGFISNTNELAKLKNTDYQARMANTILKGINNYLAGSFQKSLDTIIIKADTITITGMNPQQQAILRLTADSIMKSGNYLKATTIRLSDPKNNTEFQVTSQINRPLGNPLVVIDGERKGDTTALRNIDVNEIASIDILKDASAIAKYGEEAKYGVIEIHTKKMSERMRVEGYQIRPNRDTPIWVTGYPTKVENRRIPVEGVRIAGYNGQPKEVVVQGYPKMNFVVGHGIIASNGIKEFKESNPDVKDVFLMIKPLTLVVKLNDKTEEAYDLTNAGSKKRAEDKYGKLPTPAKEYTDGIIEENPGESASFPGGQAAWAQYLIRNLDRDIVKKKGGPPGRYMVIVSFTVDTEGNLSNIKAETDPGYGAKEEAERVISKGPKWIPAVKDGKKINSVHKQSITFLVSENKAD